MKAETTGFQYAPLSYNLADTSYVDQPAFSNDDFEGILLCSFLILLSIFMYVNMYAYMWIHIFWVNDKKVQPFW